MCKQKINSNIISIVVKNLTIGGAENQAVLLARCLSELYDIHFIIINGEYKESKYIHLLSEYENIKIKALNGTYISKYFKLCKYFRNEKIEFAFSYLTGANLFTSIASRMVGVDKVFIGIRNAYLPFLKRNIDRFLTNNVSTYSVLNCYSGMEYLLECGFNRKRMVVIPNCLENIEPYRVNNKIDDSIIIISVGRFVLQKDYFTAIEAIYKLHFLHRNIVYYIVGYGELEIEIKDFILKLGLDGIVKILINPPNIPTLLNDAHIYLSTSLFEGTSNSIMEAMNANLPIVATNVGDNCKLINHGINGFLCQPKNVAIITDSLNKLIISNDLRLSMGENSKILLKRHYSVDIFREKYKNLIEN